MWRVWILITVEWSSCVFSLTLGGTIDQEQDDFGIPFVDTARPACVSLMPRKQLSVLLC